MQQARAKAEAQSRKTKLTNSYQELLDEFSNKDLKSVGNYTLGRLIGKGSFGKVYLATHKLTNGSKVVLKSAKKDDSNLAREIHHHRQFVHPHIARLYEVIVTETMVWLVLEYCQGDELYNHLLKYGRLPVEKVQKTFTQLVGAVSYVHQQSCVHRDLKLENILLDKHENVKLVDFGFTREYEGKANYLQTFCGTICYSAPEMLKGEKYAGEKVDVWSLGIILYALLCGELPFDDDEDDVTRRRILTEEPNYPDDLPPDALALIKLMLSKRPLLRPTLPDILGHSFLADYAAQQQVILKLQRPAPFTTALEKETLQRMRSAGVDIDMVIESVLSQRCDALAGWWTLLIEKEERKYARRERKRKEREQERRSSRRLSAASSRLERLATVGEEGGAARPSLAGARAGSRSSVVLLGDPPTPKSRGRSQRRSGTFDTLRIEDFPGLTELGKLNDGTKEDRLRHPGDRDSLRSVSSSQQRPPIPPPKEGVLRSARSRGSTLHLVTTTDALEAVRAAAAGEGPVGDYETGLGPSGPQSKVRRKTSQVIITHWKNMTHWIVESTRRGKGTGKNSHSTPNLLPKPGSRSGKDGSRVQSKDGTQRPQTSKYPQGSAAVTAVAAAAAAATLAQTSPMPRGVMVNGFGGRMGAAEGGNGQAAAPGRGTGARARELSVGGSSITDNTKRYSNASIQRENSQLYSGSGSQRRHSSYKRQSLSPSPLTPRSSTVRRSSHGLRGRKSTSSSVSSIRSLHLHHHQHSHSKASSTSSNGSVATSTLSKTPMPGRSPHHSSVKVLPATPTTTSFPNNLRLVRAGSSGSFGYGSYGGYGNGNGMGVGAGSGSITPTMSTFNEGMPMDRPMPGSPNPFGFERGGTPVMFAKRKRNIFKGPMLSFGGGGGRVGTGFGGALNASGSRNTGSGSHSRSASASGLDRRSGEITIAEEDEDEDTMVVYGDVDMEGLEEVEEVESFSPVIRRPGEQVEEIYEEEAEEMEEREISTAGKTA